MPPCSCEAARHQSNRSCHFWGGTWVPPPSILSLMNLRTMWGRHPPFRELMNSATHVGRASILGSVSSLSSPPVAPVVHSLSALSASA